MIQSYLKLQNNSQTQSRHSCWRSKACQRNNRLPHYDQATPRLNLMQQKTAQARQTLNLSVILTLIFKKWGGEQYLLLQNAPSSYFVSSKGGLNFKATQPKFISLKCINLSHFASVLALQAPFHAALRYSYEGKIYLLCKRCRHLAKVPLYRARNS